MIGNDGGGGKEKMRSSGGRSFQRRVSVMDDEKFAKVCGLGDCREL